MMTLRYDNLSKNELLVYIRKNSFQNVAKEFVHKYTNLIDYNTISEYKIADNYIDTDKYGIYDLSSKDFELIHKIINTNEVILRDRLLRNIELIKAKELIYKVSKWFIGFFNEANIKVLVFHIVDNYVVDIMIRIARFYNINAIGICPIFFSGYKRITIYGENNQVRDVELGEIKQVKKTLEHNFKSHMTPSIAKSLKIGILSYVKYKIKYLYFYIYFHKILKRENYDYYSLPYGAATRSLSYFFPFKYFTSELPKDSRKSIYIPMHYYPEATVEYWSNNLKDVDYISSLFEAIKHFSDQGYHVYLKEHPGMCFQQPLSIYDKIKKIKNVDILHPFIDTSDVLDIFDNIVVWTGSTGVESLLRDKTVFFMCSNYYFKKTNNDLYQTHKLHSEEEKEKFIKYILSNTIQWK